MVHKAMKFTPEVLLSAPRRSAGIPNASGTKVLYTSSTYNFDTHTKASELRVLDIASGGSVQLGLNDGLSDVNWLNEDEFVGLQAEKDGTTNVYWASVSRCLSGVELGKSHYITGTIDGAVGDLKIRRLNEDEYAILVSGQANPDGSLFNSNKTKKTHSTGRLYTGLYVRHWDRWETEEKNALWFAKLSRKGKDDSTFKLSELTNALKGSGLESPIRPFGGADNFDLSQDRIVFVAKDPELNPALNTRENLYIVNVADWEGKKPVTLEEINMSGFDGASSSPTFSPDGQGIVFLKMATNGYEADQNAVFLIRDIKMFNAPLIAPMYKRDSWNRSPSAASFSTDGMKVLLLAEDTGAAKVFEIDLEHDINNGRPPRALTQHGSISDVRPLSGGRIFVSGSSFTDNSFFAILDPLVPDRSLDSIVAWTNSNSGHGAKLGLSPKQVSSIWTPASNPNINKDVHSLVVKPSNFKSGKKYPVAYIIHGGPQSAWNDSWSTRWNPAVFAEQGYIVINPNPTGSTGYGQEFTDAIRRNWGGDPYQDIVNVFEWVSENLPEADNDRAVALGASYGGYMMNWIQGHDLGRKFKCLVCHDGITSFSGSMLGTEELYFPFYDLGGTPWFDPGFMPAPGDSSSIAQANKNFGPSTLSDWRQWDPSEHFANWSTPELVIHSSKDYRLPIAEGLAAFNVLQARKVDSQFLTFEDENHWVLNPENSLLWHKVVLNWVNKYSGLEPYAEEDIDGVELYGGLKDDDKALSEMPTQGNVAT